MKKINQIGEQIRKLRKRAGISQMELENRINTGYGSISRIENNEVNPTKETLLKIISELNLPVHDAASLMGLDIKDFFKMLEVIKILNSTLDLETVLQNSVNEISYKVGLLGAGIAIIEGDHLQGKTITQSIWTKPILKVVGNPINRLVIPLKDTNNLIAQSIHLHKEIIGKSTSSFMVPAISKKLAEGVAKVANIKCCMSMPIYYENKPLGAILFCKSYVDDFSNELPVLRAFTDHIGVAITNAQKYQALQDEISLLKNKR